MKVFSDKRVENHCVESVDEGNDIGFRDKGVFILLNGFMVLKLQDCVDELRVEEVKDLDRN